MKLSSDSYLYMVIMVIAVVVIGASLRLEQLMTKLVPLLLGGIVFILAAVGVSREIRTGDRQKTVVTEDEMAKMDETIQGWRRYLVHGAWLVGFLVGVYLLGFIIAMPLFILSYTRWLGTRWRVAIPMAAIFPALIYTIFVLVLQFQLYEGLLFKWFF